MLTILSLCNGNIKDHHNKYKNNENVWNIVRITKMWHRDTEWANAVGKSGANRHSMQGCHKPLIYKNKQTKQKNPTIICEAQ